MSHLTTMNTINSTSTSNYVEGGVIDENSEDDSVVRDTSNSAYDDISNLHWEPSSSHWKNFWHFVGPGWFVSIAYMDPGNYQADIQAGATSRYSLLFAVWWTSILSIYVQVLCVRLAYYGQVTLAEAQALDTPNRFLRYLNWSIAELSTILTDLPEVIGIGIALHIFFGWPYYVGVLLSLGSTMLFLTTLRLGIQSLEIIICGFVTLMGISLLVEMSLVGVNGRELMKGWVYGFTSFGGSDLFSLTGILGSVVMPHNLYLHTAACQSRPVHRNHVAAAVRYCSWEPVVPILVSFVINMAVVSIAAERVYGTEQADQVGLTDFCTFFQVLKGGCVLWAISLLASGQSSAITTTFTGQYVMDGFLKIQLPVEVRAILTRLIAMTPCVIISVLFPDHLNQMVNVVNSAIGFLLPFAFTPLVKYNCSQSFLGEFAAKGWERKQLYSFAVAVYFINAYSLSARGGGFFGSFVPDMEQGARKTFYMIVQVLLHLFYFGWNAHCIMTPVIMTPFQEARPLDPQFAPKRLGTLA